MTGSLLFLTVGCLLGRYELKKWDIYETKGWWLLNMGIFLAAVPGGYLMGQYGYHILKILRYWLILGSLVFLGILDHKKRIIPNRILVVLLGARTLLLAVECLVFQEVWVELFLSSMTGFLGGGMLFFLTSRVMKNGIGMGDVKLIAVLGYYLGFQVLMSDMVISLLLTVVGGLTSLLIQKKSLRSELPFAPFVAAGTMITILLGC